jgi:hypothetical protein
MVYSGVGYCACGQEIWLEYLRDGLAWRPRFTDVEGRELTRCPGCGRELKDEELGGR